LFICQQKVIFVKAISYNVTCLQAINRHLGAGVEQLQNLLAAFQLFS